jgi:hypothetical protein
MVSLQPPVTAELLHGRLQRKGHSPDDTDDACMSGHMDEKKSATFWII